jgi:hypothetical protein
MPLLQDFVYFSFVIETAQLKLLGHVFAYRLLIGVFLWPDLKSAIVVEIPLHDGNNYLMKWRSPQQIRSAGGC